jgi:exonuclease VII small subunit
MAVNWVEVAHRMAENARANLAQDRKRLQKILAERNQQSAPEDSSDNFSPVDTQQLSD